MPGIDLDAVELFQSQQQAGGIYGLLNLFSGGALEQFSVFALGIIPYITASIIMQLLTVVASIFIPLTFIAGIYGMNFEHMPELGKRWAYPATLGAMAAIAGGMLHYFRRKGWFGRKRDADDR